MRTIKNNNELHKIKQIKDTVVRKNWNIKQVKGYLIFRNLKQ